MSSTADPRSTRSSRSQTPVRASPEPAPFDPLAQGARAADWAPLLIQALAAQCELCTALQALAERQSVLIRSGDGDALLRVLAERQGLVDQISELNDHVAPYRRQWETCMAAVSPEQRAALDTLVSTLTLAVDAIARQDDADRAALESQRSAISAELTGVVRGKGAVAAYAGSHAPPQPRYQDQNG